MSFNSLGLTPDITDILTEKGYTTPTSIQETAIPIILGGDDLMACSQTGTGKTACFVLPILHRLQENGRKPPIPSNTRVLILSPTRELAVQIEQNIIAYGRKLSLRTAAVYGGVDIMPQIKRLRSGVDILVATPGRLLDHIRQKTVQLSKVEILVLDEADRMLDMGFIRDIKLILELMPTKRQNLLFSATFSEPVKQLADGFMSAPKLIEIAPTQPCAEQIAQLVYPVDTHRKCALLTHLITAEDWQQVLVFTRTKHSANKLVEQLEASHIRATAIHSNKSQAARMRALSDFKRGVVRVLVATDIVARGLDIKLLPHVVNYELPEVPSDYIHRIGRTGRAGNTGLAISLVSVDERKLLRDIERLLRLSIPQSVMPGYEVDPNIEPQPIRKRMSQPFRKRPGGGGGRDRDRRPPSGGGRPFNGGKQRREHSRSGGGGRGRSS